MIWAETNNYKHTCHLIEVFRSSDIESFVIVGGVSIRCTPDKLPLINEICLTEEAILRTGFEGVVAEILAKDIDGREMLLRATGNGKAIVQEWEE
jgi:hypothetical protein